MHNERSFRGNSFLPLRSSAQGSYSESYPASGLIGQSKQFARPAQSYGFQEGNNTSSNNRGYLVQKVEALFPYLNEILGQNDLRTNNIVGKLIGLRDNLDGIFEDIEQELDQTEN